MTLFSKWDCQKVFSSIQVKTWVVIKIKYKNIIFSYSDWYIDQLTCIFLLISRWWTWI